MNYGFIEYIVPLLLIPASVGACIVMTGIFIVALIYACTSTLTALRICYIRIQRTRASLEV